MSEPIKTGDLVVMVRGYKPDCQCEPVGVPFKVSRIRGSYEPLRCHCAEQLPACQVAEGFDSYRVVPLQWLKKIPPLDELDLGEAMRNLREMLTT